jgi:cell wall assembly regulator SMI1
MSELRAALAELEAAWVRLGCPVQEYYAPGASRDEIVEAVSFITPEPPQELIDWYEWHNGWIEWSRAIDIAPSGFWPLSLREAREERDTTAWNAIRASDDPDPDAALPPDYYWDPNWWPIGWALNGSQLVLDLASKDQTCVVRNVEWEDVDFRKPMAPSLLEVVRFFLEVVDLGILTWVEESRIKWNLDFALVPVEMRRRMIFR